MNFKKAILLPIFEYTEEEMTSRNLGIENEEHGMDQISIRAFWTIDAAWKEQHRSENTCFISGGEIFITRKVLKDFVDLINKHLTL